MQIALSFFSNATHRNCDETSWMVQYLENVLINFFLLRSLMFLFNVHHELKSIDFPAEEVTFSMHGACGFFLFGLILALKWIQFDVIARIRISSFLFVKWFELWRRCFENFLPYHIFNSKQIDTRLIWKFFAVFSTKSLQSTFWMQDTGIQFHSLIDLMEILGLSNKNHVVSQWNSFLDKIMDFGRGTLRI